MAIRPQFRLSTLLWLTLAAACWHGGMRFERWLGENDDQSAPIVVEVKARAGHRTVLKLDADADFREAFDTLNRAAPPNED
jgi:hypothetical protein